MLFAAPNTTIDVISYAACANVKNADTTATILDSTIVCNGIFILCTYTRVLET
jgi:hypothetical protein